MTDKFMVDLRYTDPGFNEQFLGVSLQTRRAAWEWFQSLPALKDANPCNRVASFNQKVCCPWGAILVAMDEERAKGLRYLRPNPWQIPDLAHEFSGGEAEVDADLENLTGFTSWADGGNMTLEQVHRLMVPEDFAEAPR